MMHNNSNNLTIPAGATALVAMSGGVDSSVTAALLLERGVHCIGVTMQHKPSGQEQDIADAKAVCQTLGMEHYTINIVGEYENFLENSIRAVYAKGETPNPCVLCNEQMKFGLFFNKFLALAEANQWVRSSSDTIYYASGHYAKVVQLESGHYAVAKAPYAQKDQSYFLYRLNQEQLSRLRFPLGEMEKPQVRVLAEKYGLTVKQKPDSQDFCMHSSVLRPKSEKPTILVDKNGKVLGAGLGLSHYTIGMRRGLGVNSLTPLYVIAMIPEEHKIVLGDESDLYKNSFCVDNLVYIEELLQKNDLWVKIRSMSHPQKASIHRVDEQLFEVQLDEPLRAITKGQSAVFYDENAIVLGGGFIA